MQKEQTRAATGEEKPGDFFQMHQMEMNRNLSLKLSFIEGVPNGCTLASGWTNDEMRKESITDRCSHGRRDTIQEIVQSFN